MDVPCSLRKMLFEVAGRMMPGRGKAADPHGGRARLRIGQAHAFMEFVELFHPIIPPVPGWAQPRDRCPSYDANHFALHQVPAPKSAAAAGFPMIKNVGCSSSEARLGAFAEPRPTRFADQVKQVRQPLSVPNWSGS